MQHNSRAAQSSITDSIIRSEQQVLMSTYARPPMVISHGKGVYLYDLEGRRYLDFVAGIAVNALGYGDPGVRRALDEQADRLWHCSNLYYTEPQVRLAEDLVRFTFADRVFFCNSGAEAIEGAIKCARRWANQVKGEENGEIIAFNNSFHGRTMGALSATGQPKFWEGFGPMVPGFCFAEYNDLSSVQALHNEKTCAILVEPVQGESGIHPASPEFLTGLRRLCSANRCLLIFDEIQCGLGRCGAFCAHERYGVTPDILTLAKPLAAGLPLGALLTRGEAGETFAVGSHGTTFGGGPLTTHVARYMIKRLREPGFLQGVNERGAHLRRGLEALARDFEEIVDVRGLGLMAGIDLTLDTKKIISHCCERGLLVCRAGENTIRFLPPLIVTNEEIDTALKLFREALDKERA